MTRYKPTEFVDEDTSSIGSIQLNDATSPSVHFGYTSARVFNLNKNSKLTVEKTYIILGYILLV